MTTHCGLVTYCCETMAPEACSRIYAAELAHFNFFIMAFINTSNELQATFMKPQNTASAEL